MAFFFIFKSKVEIHNFSRQIKVVNSYLAYNRNIFTNFLPWKKLTIFSRQIKVRVFFLTMWWSVICLVSLDLWPEAFVFLRCTQRHQIRPQWILHHRNFLVAHDWLEKCTLMGLWSCVRYIFYLRNLQVVHSYTPDLERKWNDFGILLDLIIHIRNYLFGQNESLHFK